MSSPKDTGLHITDRINLWWQAEPETSEAIREHQRAISDKVLAASFTEASAPDGVPEHQDDQLGVRFAVEKAS